MAKMMRNKAKAGIDKAARGARRVSDSMADASDRNKRPSSRTGSKVKAAVDRLGDKVKQGTRSIRNGGRRARTRTRSSARTG